MVVKVLGEELHPIEVSSLCKGDVKMVDMKDTKIKAKELEKTMQCNCDLDNWQPERTTGHSCVCRIHEAATR